MKAGPKAAVEPTPLPWRPRSTGSARFAAFCRKFLRVPRGHGALRPLTLRDWQRELVGSVLDAETQPRLAAWCLPRGSGKTSLMASWALYELFCGPEGASVVVVATDERQAGILFGIAARMVELNDDLSARCQVFRDRLVVPVRGANLQVLPAEPKRLEGLDPSLAIIDELGVVSRDTYEVVLLASGKRPVSTVVGIGTPGPTVDNVLADLRSQHLAGQPDPSFVYREHSASGFEDHPVDCSHCWELANPALDDFLARDALRALLPPRTRESSFRRARLCQFVVGGGDAFVQPEVWARCADPLRTIPDGARVVLGLDGSHANDATALVAVSVEVRPRIEPVGIWTPTPGDPDGRVPVLDVEEAIRRAAKRWDVLELTGDPWRWTRTLQLLADEGLTVSEYPQTAVRLSPATTALSEAIHNVELSHTGDELLTRHVLNATVTDDARGVRVQKVTKHSRQRIDALVAALMAFDRAKWHAGQKPRRSRVVAWS